MKSDFNILASDIQFFRETSIQKFIYVKLAKFVNSRIKSDQITQRMDRLLLKQQTTNVFNFFENRKLVCHLVIMRQSYGFN